MSQASKAIKEIAAGQEYTSLVQATEKSDYEAITNAYRQLANLLEEKKKAILEQIDSLPKQNAEENRQQFLTAFTQRMESSLPQFYKLFKLISEQKIAEGEVFDTGSKGDPIIRTPDGKTVIVSGVKAEKGVRIKYKVTNEGQKFDFARAVELNADFFYTMLNQEITGRIQEAFNAVEARMRSGTQEITPNSLNELLAGLEKARETACGLKTAEQEQTNGRILALRKRLLGDYGIRLAFDFIAREEEKEIRTLYAGDEQKASLALAAPGIFRRQGYYAFKNGLFAGRNLKGKEEIQKTLESNVETMDSA
jgi:predicted RNA-binding protein with TRAM domain